MTKTGIKLYGEMTEAITANDVARFRELTQEAAEKRQETENSMSTLTWEEAIEKVNTMQPPDAARQGVALNDGASHEIGRQQHMLMGYKYDFFVGKYPARFTWCVCPQCRKLWNKTIAIFNNDENTAHTRDIVHKGETVTGVIEPRNIADVAVELFKY